MGAAQGTTLKFFGAGMKVHRQQRSLSQLELAALCEVSVVTINHVEGAKRGVSLTTLEKIAASLNSTVAALIESGSNVLTADDSGLTRGVLAANVRRFRTERGLSQEDLAAAAHVSTSTVASIENCRKAATVDVIHVIARALNTSVHSLFLPEACEPDMDE